MIRVQRDDLSSAAVVALLDEHVETGSSDFYLPAQRLYLRNGFVFRGPFADYREDPNSVYMELRLR